MVFPRSTESFVSGMIFVANIGDSHAVLCCSESNLGVLLTTDDTPYNKDEMQRVLDQGGYIPRGGMLRVNDTLAVTRSFGDLDFKLTGLLTPDPHIVAINMSQLNAGNYTLSEKGGDIMKDLSNKFHPDYYKHTRAYLQELSVNECSMYTSLMREIRPDGDSYFLIVASDGLWDVVPIDTATELVCQFFNQQLEHWRMRVGVGEREDNDADWQDTRASWYHEAAKLLALEAYVRGSTDNIGVCIVHID